jgi:hypothetical protein
MSPYPDCAVCGLPMDDPRGHNAMPLRAGRCCNQCDDEVVMATRLVLLGVKPKLARWAGRALYSIKVKEASARDELLRLADASYGGLLKVTIEKRSAPPAGSRRCTSCGRDFEPTKYSVHKQKYCSYGCKRRATVVKQSLGLRLNSR